MGAGTCKKRTESLNGKLIIDSTPGKGTHVIMSLPYPFKNTKSMGFRKE